MRFVCPVAKCHEKVSPENYYEHVIEYEEKYKDNPILAKSHDRFCAYFYPTIWNSDHSLKYKYRNIAKAYIEDQKKFKEFKKKYNKPKKDDVKHFDMDRLIGIHH